MQIPHPAPSKTNVFADNCRQEALLQVPAGPIPRCIRRTSSPSRSPTPEKTARSTAHAHHPPGTNDPWANLEPSDEHPNGPILGRTLTLIAPGVVPYASCLAKTQIGRLLPAMIAWSLRTHLVNHQTLSVQPFDERHDTLSHTSQKRQPMNSIGDSTLMLRGSGIPSDEPVTGAIGRRRLTARLADIACPAASGCLTFWLALLESAGSRWLPLSSVSSLSSTPLLLHSGAPDSTTSAIAPACVRARPTLLQSVKWNRQSQKGRSKPNGAGMWMPRLQASFES